MIFTAYCASCGWEEGVESAKNALDMANAHLVRCAEYKKVSRLGRGDMDHDKVDFRKEYATGKGWDDDEADA